MSGLGGKELPQITKERPVPPSRREQARLTQESRLRINDGPMIGLPLTRQLVGTLADRLAQALDARGQRGILGALATYTTAKGDYFRLPEVINFQRRLNPALRAIMATVKGSVANDARQLYLALWSDVENGVLAAPAPGMREHWQPLLQDAKEYEAQQLLEALIRQAPGQTDKPGAFTFLQRVLKNRSVFEALLGEADTSEILQTLADPAWENRAGRQAAMPPMALPMPPGGMPPAAPARSPMPNPGMLQELAARSNRIQAAQPRRNGAPDFGQMLAASRPLTSDPLAAALGLGALGRR